MLNNVRIKKLLLRIRNLPRLTVRGMVLLVSGVIGFYAGFYFGDLLIIQFSLFIFIILAVSFFIAENNLRNLDFKRDLGGNVFAGQPVNVRINIKNQRNLSNSYCLALEDQLLGNGFFNRIDAGSAILSQITDKLLLDEIPAVKESTYFADTVIRKRGVYHYFCYRCNSTFPFGLFRKEMKGMLRTDISVYPNPLVPLVAKDFCGTGTGEKEGMSRFSKDSQGSFKGMGEYASGDPVNLIHWPLSARYQKVVIKEFDNASPDDYTVIFHSYMPKGEYRSQSPERSMGLLAGIFIQLFNNGNSFIFVSDLNNWETIQVNENAYTLEDALLCLSVAKPKIHQDLAALQDQVNSSLLSDNKVIVLSNTPKKYWEGKLGTHPSLLCLDNKVKFEKLL